MVLFFSSTLFRKEDDNKMVTDVVLFLGSRSKCPDYIAVVNGYTGNVLQLTGIPDQGPLSIGPLLKGSGDGSTLVLYSTEGANGSLFMATLKDIASGRKDLVWKVDIIFSEPCAVYAERLSAQNRIPITRTYCIEEKLRWPDRSTVVHSASNSFPVGTISVRLLAVSGPDRVEQRQPDRRDCRQRHHG